MIVQTAEWPTTDEVMALREEFGFVTPIRPFEHGDKPWCVFATQGRYELMMHPLDALTYMRILGVRLVGEWPFLNAWQLLFVDSDIRSA